MSIHNGAAKAVETLANRTKLVGRREFEFTLETEFPEILAAEYPEIISAIYARRGDRGRSPIKPEELGRPFVPTKGEAELSKKRTNGHSPTVRLGPVKALKEKLKAIILWYPLIDPKLVYEVLAIKSSYTDFDRLFVKMRGEVRRRKECGHSFPAAMLCSANDTIQRIIELGTDRGMAKNFPPLPAGRVMEPSVRPRQEVVPPAPAAVVPSEITKQPAPQVAPAPVPSKGRRGRMTRAEEIALESDILEKLAANESITAKEAYKQIGPWVRECTFKKYFLRIQEQLRSADISTPPELPASEEPAATEKPTVIEVVETPEKHAETEPAPLVEAVSMPEAVRTVTFKGGHCTVTMHDGVCDVSFEALGISPDKAAQLLDIATRLDFGI